jgi:hypothetical protein
MCSKNVVEVRMMKKLLVASLLLAALLVVSAQAGAAKPQPNKVKQTASPTWTLAMDGPRVAYASGGRIYVWNVVTGATSVVKGTYSNARHTDNAAEIAIADKRIAWTRRHTLGNFEASERLYTAPVAGRARPIGSAHIGAGHTGWIGGVVGSGHVLAVSTWRWDGTAVTERRLKLVTPTGLRQIASGPGAIVAASADGGHIAAFRSTAAWPEGPANYEYPPPPTTAPSVGIYSAKGALLSEIALKNNPDAMLKVALRGNQLVVLTVATPPSGPRTATLEVYNWKAGELVHTWPLASDISPDLLGVSGRIAVLQGSRGLKGSPGRGSLHLVDLASGKDVAFAANGWRGIVTGWGPATIGPRGLVYAVNTQPAKRHPYGRLIFVPTAKLLAALSK